MNETLHNLLKLQVLEFGESSAKDIESGAAGLRARIPPPILAHYDRLRARGKKGVAIVANQVCTGCHMQIPIGVITTLMRAGDVQLCDSCGRYLYLPDPSRNPAPELPAAKKVNKPEKKTKRKKSPAHAG